MKHHFNVEQLLAIQSRCAEFNREIPSSWLEQMQLREACRNDFAQFIRRSFLDKDLSGVAVLGGDGYDISSS